MSTPVISKSKGLYYLFDITEFRFIGSYVNVLKALGGNLYFDISAGHNFLFCFRIAILLCNFEIA